MLKPHPCHRLQQHGTSMIEVLVTIVIVAFGLLGLAGLQSSIQLALVESYQRAQAILLLSNMTDRMSTNRSQAANYVSGNSFGTGDTQPADCTALAIGTARDQCEWSNALKGSAESSGTTKVGAMVGGRGCIELIQAADASTGVCKPGIYQVTVAWQGMNKTKAPSATCGKDSYGDETYRRAISMQLSVGLLSCS